MWKVQLKDCTNLRAATEVRRAEVLSAPICTFWLTVVRSNGIYVFLLSPLLQCLSKGTGEEIQKTLVVSAFQAARKNAILDMLPSMGVINPCEKMVVLPSWQQENKSLNERRFRSMDAQPFPSSPGIYCIRCVPTHRTYVGSAKDIAKRWHSHRYELQRGKHHNAILQNAWDKYGASAFVFEVLEYVLIPDLLTAREQYWFSKLHPFGKRGFNLSPTAGSTLGIKASQVTKQRQSASHQGRPQSEEHKRKRAEAQRGKTHRQQAKDKVSYANKGRRHTPEEDMSKMKELIITDPNGDEYTILGVNKFCDAHGLSSASLMNVANGKCSQHKGYRARYPGTEPQEPKTRREKREPPPKKGKGKGEKRPYERYEWSRKTLILTDPNGVEYMVHGINDFCKAHGLDSSCIAKVARGKHSQHKGWTARHPETDVS